MATIIDTSSSKRITLLTQLMEEMTRIQTPRDAVDLFTRGLQQAYQPPAVLHLSTLGLPAGQFRVARLSTAEGGDVTPPVSDPWSAPASLPVHSTGFFSELVGRLGPAVVHDLDLSDDPAVGGALAAYRSLVAVQVVDASLPVNWVVLLHPDADHFQVDDLEELILRANLVAAVAKGLKTSQELAVANLRIAREIEQIARIQKTLLPSELPQIPGLSLAAHFATFDRAGGDLYDVAPLSNNGTADDRWAILVADASGHGPAAATVCAMVNSILHAYPRRPKGPAEVLRYVNRHLCNKQIELSFVTAFLAFYDPATRELTYSRAGHNPPVVMSAPGAGGQAARGIGRYLDGAGGLPLGIDGDAPFGEDGVALAAGELVLMYTDGITEAKSPAGAEFGVEGIEAALAGCADGPAHAVRCVIEALAAHQGTWRPADDQTMLAVQAE